MVYLLYFNQRINHRWANQPIEVPAISPKTKPITRLLNKSFLFILFSWCSGTTGVSRIGHFPSTDSSLSKPKKHTIYDGEKFAEIENPRFIQKAEQGIKQKSKALRHKVAPSVVSTLLKPGICCQFLDKHAWKTRLLSAKAGPGFVTVKPDPKGFNGLPVGITKIWTDKVFVVEFHRCK